MERRAFLSLSLALGIGALTNRATATPTSPLLESEELVLEGERDLARRALLLRPRRDSAAPPLPLLVLLHGLGETGNERAGLEAWSRRYGLIAAYERLSRPPVGRILNHPRYLTDTHLTAINEELAQRPFAGMALVCPVTPNVYKHRSTSRALDRYADWLGTVLLPAVRAACPIAEGRDHLAIDGCSLGGFIALEVMKRRPEQFGTLGMVQGAIGLASVESHADALRSLPGLRRVRLGTSSQDPYRRANEALAEALARQGVGVHLEVTPGPHDQPWLREVGTLSMLKWHDQEFARRTS